MGNNKQHEMVSLLRSQQSVQRERQFVYWGNFSVAVQRLFSSWPKNAFGP
jgi:hypothetical protein